MVQRFLKEFTSKLTKKFKKEIDFVILFGSAARGEWKRGVSDVDLIIQVKKQEYISAVKDYAETIFWELDKKYDTKFREVCSTADGKDKIKGILKKTKLYVPFEVFGPEDIDWRKGKIKKKELLLGANLIASQAMLFKKMKYEGKILYGRDVRKSIRFKTNRWEKFKAIMIPFYMAVISSLTALIIPQMSLKFANKAVIYSIESILFFLDRPIGRGLEKATEEWERELKEKIKYKYMGVIEIDFIMNFDYRKLMNFNFAKQALKIKHNWKEESKKFGRWETLKFCWMSIFFINSMNWYSIIKSDKHRIILKSLFIFRVVILFLVIGYFVLK